MSFLLQFIGKQPKHDLLRRILLGHIFSFFSKPNSFWLRRNHFRYAEFISAAQKWFLLSFFPFSYAKFVPAEQKLLRLRKNHFFHAEMVLATFFSFFPSQIIFGCAEIISATKNLLFNRFLNTIAFFRVFYKKERIFE